MRMNGIIIGGPSNSALINRVHICTLKSIDNSPSFSKVPHIFLLEI